MKSATIETTVPATVDPELGVAIAVTFAALTFTVSAQAAQYRTAGTLAAYCGLDHGDNSITDGLSGYKIGDCVGYMGGWMDAHSGLWEDDVNLGQMQRVFVLYMKNHPEDENKAAAEVMPRAMRPLLK